MSITSGQDPDEGFPTWYDRMFRACEVTPGKEGELQRACSKVMAGLPRYRNVAHSLGFFGEEAEITAFVIGVVHYKEASCDFSRVLHNGEKIVGTGQKTKLVPKGLGPFDTWEASAHDALLANKSFFRVSSKEIGDILYVIERYNGTGYITGKGKADTSPYLWACSNINDGKGLYTKDGEYDPEASTRGSIGAAVILKELYNMNIFKCLTSWMVVEKKMPLNSKELEGLKKNISIEPVKVGFFQWLKNLFKT